MVIYSKESLWSLLTEYFNKEVVCRKVESLWDISFIENLYMDTKNGENIVVLNPNLDFFDKNSFKNFIDYAQKKKKNAYFSPQINPHFFVNDPVWFYIESLDSIRNFIVEFLYRDTKIGTKFRNFMHKEMRGSSVSRMDVPKYLTNLHSQWCRYEDNSLSSDFLKKYSNVYYPYPSNIHVALSNRCNLKCIMCPYHAPQYKQLQTGTFFNKAHFMDVATFTKIAKYCGENQIFMQFGQLDEPLVHKNFLEFLEIAKSYNVKVNLTTNGTLLDKKIAEKIVESSINNINFSLDAIDKESYKKIRGYDYEDTISNIEYLRECLVKAKKDIQTSVCFILQGENAEEKSKNFLNYWITRVNKVKFHQLSEYERQGDLFVTKKKKELFREIKEDRYPCSIPWQVLFVTADSKVTFCCNSMSEYATSTPAGGGQSI